MAEPIASEPRSSPTESEIEYLKLKLRLAELENKTPQSNPQPTRPSPAEERIVPSSSPIDNQKAGRKKKQNAVGAIVAVFLVGLVAFAAYQNFFANPGPSLPMSATSNNVTMTITDYSYTTGNLSLTFNLDKAISLSWFAVTDGNGRGCSQQNVQNTPFPAGNGNRFNYWCGYVLTFHKGTTYTWTLTDSQYDAFHFTLPWN